MIIPVRCFTCGCLLSDKWVKYEELCVKYRTELQQTDTVLLDADVLKQSHKNMTAEGKAMEDIHVHRMCCKRHFLCNVDMMKII